MIRNKFTYSLNKGNFNRHDNSLYDTFIILYEWLHDNEKFNNQFDIQRIEYKAGSADRGFGLMIKSANINFQTNVMNKHKLKTVNDFYINNP